MTVAKWGLITPVQGDMLKLAGHVLHVMTRPRGAVSDADRMESMRQGLDRLRNRTGQDFGYDLGGWHDLLLNLEGDELGYRHPFAWRGVRQAIEEAILDPDRIRFAQVLERTG